MARFEEAQKRVVEMEGMQEEGKQAQVKRVAMVVPVDAALGCSPGGVSGMPERV